MNVLLTGGAGFIGTHLTRRLLNQGHSITILDNFLPQVHGSVTDLPADVRPHVRLLRGDVADESALRPALEGAECVVHLAAETGTGQSMYEAARYSRTNVTGTALLFDLLIQDKSRRVQRVIVASSRAIYGEGAWFCPEHRMVFPRSRSAAEKSDGHFDPLCPECGASCTVVPTPETAPLQPTSFYGLTKQTQEQMTLMFGQVLGIPSVALRYQNVFGPGQSLKNPYTGILAIFSDLARKAQPILVFEDGQESRDFVYIEDVVEATSRAVSGVVTGCHSVNVGSGRSTMVLQVAQMINEHYGGRSEIRITGAFREGDIRHCVADLRRAENLIGFVPRWSFSGGLEKFLAWADETGPGDSAYERSLAEMKDRGLLRA